MDIKINGDRVALNTSILARADGSFYDLKKLITEGNNYVNQ